MPVAAVYHKLLAKSWNLNSCSYELVQDNSSTSVFLSRLSKHTTQLASWFINIDPELCLIKCENICPGKRQNSSMLISRSWHCFVVLFPPGVSVMHSFPCHHRTFLDLCGTQLQGEIIASVCISLSRIRDSALISEEGKKVSCYTMV